MVISILGEKGGSGKTTIARLLATELPKIKSDLSVKIADMDTGQATALTWATARNRNYPHLRRVSVEGYSKLEDALDNSEDILILDTAGRTDKSTLKIALASDLIILPSASNMDDLAPTLKMAFELESKGISRENIYLCLTRISSDPELRAGMNYIKVSGNWNVLGWYPHKTILARMLSEGRSISESPYPQINARSAQIAGNIYNLIQAYRCEKSTACY